MGTFSMISFANDEEFSLEHGLFNILNKKVRKLLIPHMSHYVSGVIRDLGISGYPVNGYRIFIPSAKDNILIDRKKFKRAAAKAQRSGAGVLVVDPSIHDDIIDDNMGMIISQGKIFTPYVLVDAIKAVSALMGINFNTAQICIADASTDLGIIMTELLLDEAAYLTLCTKDRERLLERSDKYIEISGLSPVIVSNYRKAMANCDILIFTGVADIKELSSYVSRKMFIVNASGQRILPEKDLLCIDEVLLMADNEPQVDDNIDRKEFMTSRVWEGALLTLSDFNMAESDIKRTLELGRFSKKLGIRIRTVQNNGRNLSRNSIYKYC